MLSTYYHFINTSAIARVTVWATSAVCLFTNTSSVEQFAYNYNYQYEGTFITNHSKHNNDCNTPVLYFLYS